MKIKKKIPKNIDDVIAGGQTGDEKKAKGRPKNKVKKVQNHFYLPEELSQIIKDNCGGNKSVFAEKVFNFYFDAHKIKH